MLELIAICLVIWVCLMFIMGTGKEKEEKKDDGD